MPIPRPSSRESAAAAVTEPRETAEPLARVGERSIVVVGDDPLMARTLDRLLRGAGYRVSIADRGLDDPMGRPLGEARSTAALTIVDVPDDWTRYGRQRASRLAQRPERSDRILWISNISGIVDAPERCLVKPFTAGQFLTKVEDLLAERSVKITR